jgi:hypothetical protein
MSDELRALAKRTRNRLDPGQYHRLTAQEADDIIHEALRAAVEAEREALAVLVEQAGEKMWSTGRSRNHVVLAAAIRARRLRCL